MDVMQPFSVLLSLYHKEKPEFLRAALDSVFHQTVRPDEVVLVEDGPLTDELNAVVMEYAERYAALKVIRFAENRGLGRALNDGLKHCSYDLVARMDTDDVAKSHRFERQLKMFEEIPNLDVCGAWMDEFEGEPENVVSVKKLPETHEELYEYGKMRNPVNHPAVMFRKEAVQLNGNYQDYPLFEDYFLWVRMLTYGCKFYCIQESLVLFRSSSEMIKRRGGFRYAQTECRLQFLLYGLRYTNFLELCKSIMIRFVVRVIPGGLRKWIYKRIRKRK